MVEQNQDNLISLAKTYQQAFNDFTPVLMPVSKREAYKEWLVNHPEYVPSFSERMGRAMQWARENPENFGSMVHDLDAAISFLNADDSSIDATLFPNIADYKKTRKTDALPLVSSKTIDRTTDNKWSALRAAVDSARFLRLGETIKPEDGQWYSYHLFVKSDKGMVAASLVDLYENYARTLVLYPTESKIDAVLANALTEALYATNPKGDLFESLKNPEDEWIYGYDGFSPEFHQAVYSETPGIAEF